MDDNEVDFDASALASPGHTHAGGARRHGGASPDGVVNWSERVLGEVNKVFVGQRKLVRGVLASLLAEGHVLIESVPGLGKTLLGARARPCSGLLVQSHPVHARLDAFRRDRLADLRRTDQRFPISPRTGLHPAAAGR